MAEGYRPERAGLDLDPQPFGASFEQFMDEEELIPTNTKKTSDDDTGTYRKDTEDHDT